MQSVLLLKKLKHFSPVLRREYHKGVQKRYLATVKDVFPHKTDFPSRHIGPRKTEVVEMLDLLGFKVFIAHPHSMQYPSYFIQYYFQSLDELTDKAVPKHIQLGRGLKLDDPLSKRKITILIFVSSNFSIGNTHEFALD